MGGQVLDPTFPPRANAHHGLHGAGAVATRRTDWPPMAGVSSLVLHVACAVERRLVQRCPMHARSVCSRSLHVLPSTQVQYGPPMFHAMGVRWHRRVRVSILTV